MYHNNNKQKNNSQKLRGKGGIILMLSLFCLLFLISLRFGSTKISFSDFIEIFAPNGRNTTEGIIFFLIRLPRSLACTVAGMGLALSGVLLQAVTGNDLAGPNIIGVNAGAGFAMILFLAFFPNAFYLQSVAAFCGSLLSSLIIIGLANKISPNKGTLILSGIALTSLLNAGISLISLLDEDALVSYKYFSIGTVSSAKTSEIIIPFIIISVCFFIAVMLSKKTDLLYLGDEIASSLGLNVKAFRILLIILASACAASAVSFAGLLGFVGLVVPHIGRALVGNNSRYLIIFSTLLGAIILLLADTLGRVLFSPTDIPVGIIMAFVGVPFFMYLLLGKGTNRQ